MSSFTRALRRNRQPVSSRKMLVLSGLLMVLLSAGLTVIIPSGRAPPTPPTSAAPETVAKSKAQIQQLPIYFIENQGQSDQQVAYYAHVHDISAYFTAKGPMLSLQEPPPQAEREVNRVRNERAIAEAARKRWVVNIRFVGAGLVQPHGSAKVAATVNYFKGPQSGWKTNLPTYGEVIYPQVWTGIDVVYSGDGGKIKSTFRVQPGADPRQIQLAYQGADSVTLTAAGRLAVQTPMGGFEEGVPVVYQEIDGQRVPVEARYALTHNAEAGEWRHGFALGAYNKGKELIIDPILQSTYLGGGSADDATVLAVHPRSGEVYAVGYTYSSDFPGTAGGADVSCDPCASSTEVFVARLSSDLKTLLNATYLGGSQNDEGRSIAIHPFTGDVYVTGKTHSSDFPGIAGGADTGYVYPWDVTEAFVSRLSSDLTTLRQSTYIGGNAIDEGYAISIHPQSGDVYVAGRTSSDNFPGITANSADSYCAFCSYSAQLEGFVTRLSSDLKTIYQSTYLGGTGNDYINALAIHPVLGDIYVTGQTRAWDFPYIAGGADSNCQNCTRSGEPYFWEGFVTRLSPSLSNDGNAQSTYLGGRASDIGYIIAVHTDNQDIYVGGLTTSYDFPATAGGADPTCDGLSCFEPPSTGGGRFEGFISRLSSDLKTNAIKQSTYLGGATDDIVASIAIHPASGDIYATGSTDSQDFPKIKGGADTTIDPVSNLKMEAFVSQLTSDLKTIRQSSYLGGSGYNDYGRSVAIHPDTGDIYVAGMTASKDFPEISGGADEICANCSDLYPANTEAFVSRFDNLSGQQQYYLTVTMAGNGNVTSSPAGVNCGGDCNESYAGGTVVTLTATPASGSAFAGWAGDADCADGQVTMGAAKTCTATFNLNPPASYMLAVALGGTGSGSVASSPAGVNCGGDCNESYAGGTVVTLTATPSSGSAFAGWAGDADCADGQVTMSATKSCTATFNLNPPASYTLAVALGGTGSGSVASSPAGVNCGSDCNEGYVGGTVVTLTATPASGSAFAGWGGACSGTGNCQVTLIAVANITANFAVNPTSSTECLFNWAEANYPGLFTPYGTSTAVLGAYTYRHYSATNAYLGVSSIDNHLYYMGSDGVLQDEGALSHWLPLAGCGTPTLPPSDCLFNWAEANYPSLFAPASSLTAVWTVYNYRYYSATNAYLGVSTVDNHVYYQGQDGVLQDEGALSHWLPLAGCSSP